jgi:hypothetical protein
MRENGAKRQAGRTGGGSRRVREIRLRVPDHVFERLCRVADGAGARPETYLETWVAGLVSEDRGRRRTRSSRRRETAEGHGIYL